MLSVLTVQGPAERTRAEQERFLSTFLVPALVANPPTTPTPTGRRRASSTGRRRAGSTRAAKKR